jgi:hypothetical protein
MLMWAIAGGPPVPPQAASLDSAESVIYNLLSCKDVCSYLR